MSKIIEATNKILQGDITALSLIDAIANDLSKEYSDFEDITCVDTKKELILGHTVYYGLSKLKAMSQDGQSERTDYRLMVYGIFRPLDGVRVDDEDLLARIKETIAIRN